MQISTIATLFLFSAGLASAQEVKCNHSIKKIGGGTLVATATAGWKARFYFKKQLVGVCESRSSQHCRLQNCKLEPGWEPMAINPVGASGSVGSLGYDPSGSSY
ncbi:uncharacterized protein PpBr36_09869 [Pyricularia pennisetigena]|uniref:uncharacterized protein n=1 Tax=Pyricularia pennisetigena TaxID=1578925 RepID=UPI001152BF93|nr:uncharacterized protein PpBr36_09869 [Pyricularia pennisetigena]TLS22518.1 hypothetical protein PpBr36_09869 [Pyricularia pennisetigena]